MIQFLKDSWNGKAPLARVFWLLFGIGGIVVAILIVLPFAYYVPNFFNQDVASKYVDLINLISLPYVIFSGICVWRCAKNSTAIRGIIAKVLVVITVLSCVVSLVKVITNLV